MNSKKNKEVEESVLLTDTLLKITAIESLLINKGLISAEELKNEINVITDKITKYITNKVNMENVMKELDSKKS